MRNNTDRRQYLSVREAAWLLGVSPSTVRQMVRDGVLRARHRSQPVIPVSEVVRLTVGGGAP